MASILYTVPNGPSVFKGGMTINDSVHIPFLANLIDSSHELIVTEVTMQNRDTIQYFLTFDDFITFFYFGRGLGSLTISGHILSPCSTDNVSRFPGIDSLMQVIGTQLRGKKQKIAFGNHVFWGVLSSYTFRSSSEDMAINIVDFNLQMEIVDHGLRSPTFKADCAN